jgi:enediyne biosynthesis protein E11
MTTVDEVLADLTAEGDDADRLVAGLSAAQWELPTAAPGWTVAHQIAHLASGDRLVRLAATDPGAFEARMAGLRAQLGNDLDAVVGKLLTECLGGTPTETLARWRAERAAAHDVLAAVPAGQKLPWLMGAMSAASLATSRIMELFAHAQDIADGLGVTRTPTDRIRHVAWFGVRTRDLSFMARGLAPPTEEFRVELTAPSGGLWAYGPPGAGQRVTGPAADFCLLVTRRRHRDDLTLTATGPDADHWLDIAQAYLGPPGAGRRPGQFAANRA